MGGNLKNKIENYESNLDAAKEWSRIDSHFKKSKLKDLESEMDIDDEWSRIEKHFEKKKKRRLVFWLFIGLGLAFVSWWMYSSMVKENQIVKQDAELIAGVEAAVVEDVDKFIDLNNLSEETVENSNEELNKEIRKVDVALNVEDTDFEDTTVKVNENKVAFNDLNIKNAQSPTKNTSVEITEVSVPPKETSDDTDSNIQLGDETPTRGTIEYLNLQPVKTLLGFLELPYPTLDGLNLSIDFPNKVEPRSFVLAYTSQVGMVGKSGGLNSNFTSLGDYSYSNKPLEAWTNSLLLKKKIVGGFHIQTGLSYTVVNELLEFETSFEQEDVLANQNNAAALNLSGVTVQRTGNLNQYIRYNVDVKHYNKYQMLSIPIHMLYDVQFKNFTWSIGGGYEVPIYAHFEGKGIDDKGFPFLLEERTEIKKIGTYHLESTIIKRLGKRFALGFKTSFDYSTNEIIINSTSYKQSYRLLNGGLSLNYKLN